MDSRPDLSVVRIYKQEEVVGAGFLVSDKYILTCAHVVATALGIDVGTFERPTQEIGLDFPVIEPGIILKAKVEFWLPVKPNNSPEDIAVLKLIKPPPKEAIPAFLSITNGGISEHQFEAFGFPKDAEEKGIWVDGIIKRNVAYGWIQLAGTYVGTNNQNVYYLEEGFSGTAIWDKKLGAVVGMAVAADKRRSEAKIAFMIPTDLLLQAWDKLSEICTLNSRILSLITLLETYFQDIKNFIEIAYHKSLPQLSIRNFPDSILEIVKSLDSRENDSEDNYSCLEKFVCYLLLSLNNSNLKIELTNWLEHYLKNYQDLLNLLKQKEKLEKEVLKENKNPGLLVAIFDDNNSLAVQGWLIEDVKSYKPIEEVGCYSLVDEQTKLTTDKNLSNLAELIQSFYQKSLVYCQCSIQKIHVFLPYSLIDRSCRSIDSLVIEAKNPFAPSIGTKHEVVVRFSERLKLAREDQYSVAYKEKWKIVKNSLDQSVIDILHSSENTNPKNLYKQLMSDRVIGARLTEPIPQAKLEFIMQAFYFAGIPIAVWLREEASNLNCCQELNNICQGCCLEQFPQNIKDKRYQDWNKDGIGNHLSLLWDDFDLVPKRSLIMS